MSPRPPTAPSREPPRRWYGACWQLPRRNDAQPRPPRSALLPGQVDPASSFWSGSLPRRGGIRRRPRLCRPRHVPRRVWAALGIEQLEAVVGWLLRTFREQTLPIAGIGAAAPIRICENGWPTGPDRPEATQAECSRRCCARCTPPGELNVTHWELFTLRDANSSKDDMFITSASCATTTPPSRPSDACAHSSPTYRTGGTTRALHADRMMRRGPSLRTIPQP